MTNQYLPFELRTLRYFLTFVNEGGVSNASKALHITQPTLSRQLADLERNVGKQLWSKESRRITLTAEGDRLYEYARTICELSEQAAEELANTDMGVSGVVHIGAGESVGMKVIARALRQLQYDHPGISVHLSSGFTMDHMEKLNKGLLDFILECETIGRPGYGSLEFPIMDRWVALMREDDPLASRDAVRPEDFRGASVTLSRQSMKTGKMAEWFGDVLETMHVIATHNLTLNSSFLVREGLGYVFTYDDMFTAPGLVARPFTPELTSNCGLVWVKKRSASKAAQIFLDYVRRECNRPLANA